MSKVIKLIITIVVTILIILYFLVFSGIFGRTNYCSDFETVLNTRIEQHFILNTPKTEGEIVSVSVNELIANGNLTITDLEKVGTSCTGTAYASRIGDKLYYYNDIVCGSCSIDKLYGSWSDWQETLPSFNSDNYQIMIETLYNYSNSDAKYSDWSDWGEKIEDIIKPTLPSNAVEVDKEYEEDIKTEKKYLYSSVLSGQTVEGQYVYLSASEAKKACENSGYANCTTLSKQSTTYTKNEYRCEPSSFGWGSSSNTTTTSCTTSQNQTCSSSLDIGKQKVSCTETAWIPTISTCESTYAYINNTSGTASIRNTGKCYSSSDLCNALNDEIVSGLANEKKCINYSPSCSSASDIGNQKITSCELNQYICTKSMDISNCPFTWSNNVCYLYISNPTEGKCLYSGYNYIHDGWRIARIKYSLSYQTCSATYAYVDRVGNETNSCTATSNSCSQSNAGVTEVTKCTPSKYNKTVQTCEIKSYVPSPTPKKTSTVSTCTASQKCSSLNDVVVTCTPKTGTVYTYKGIASNTVYYLKSDGTTTTNQSLASYLSESEYSALKNANATLSSYSKTNISKDVATKKLIRYRIKYTDNSSVVLEEWLPLDKFEAKISSTIEEFSSNLNITIRKKILYKYRIKNSK